MFEVRYGADKYTPGESDRVFGDLLINTWRALIYGDEISLLSLQPYSHESRFVNLLGGGEGGSITAVSNYDKQRCETLMNDPLLMLNMSFWLTN